MTRATLHRLNAVLALLLVALYVAWWWFTGASAAPLVLSTLAFACASLLLPAPFLWRGSRFATTLAGFVVPFHFAFAVMELIANPDVRVWVALQTFLSLALFTFVMASLRQVNVPARG